MSDIMLFHDPLCPERIFSFRFGVIDENFDRTDDFYFKDSYENRRINITMLFGTRNIQQ